MISDTPLSTRPISDAGTAPAAAPALTPSVFPDAARRSALPVAAVMASALSLPILPNALVPSGLTQFPDRASPQRWVAAAPSGGTYDTPQASAPFVMSTGFFVDSVPRASRRSISATIAEVPTTTQPTVPLFGDPVLSSPSSARRASQIAISTTLSERTSPPAEGAFPDRTPPRVPARIGWFDVPSSPERTLPIAQGAYPDSVVPRAQARVGWFALAPSPERTSPPAIGAFPDASPRRPTPPSSGPWAPAPLPIQPTRPEPSYPDLTARVRRTSAETQANPPQTQAPTFPNGLFSVWLDRTSRRARPAIDAFAGPVLALPPLPPPARETPRAQARQRADAAGSAPFQPAQPLPAFLVAAAPVARRMATGFMSGGDAPIFPTLAPTVVVPTPVLNTDTCSWLPILSFAGDEQVSSVAATDGPAATMVERTEIVASVAAPTTGEPSTVAGDAALSTTTEGAIVPSVVPP